QPSRPPPAPSVLVAAAARLPPPRRRARRAEDLRRTRPGALRPGVRRVARLPARAPRPRPAQGRDRADPNRATAAARRSQPQEQPHSLAAALCQQPPQRLARALDLHHDRGGQADQQPRETRPPNAGHPPKTLAWQPKRQRGALRRTGSLDRRNLPTPTPPAVHLSQPLIPAHTRGDPFPALT